MANDFKANNGVCEACERHKAITTKHGIRTCRWCQHFYQPHYVVVRTLNSLREQLNTANSRLGAFRRLIESEQKRLYVEADSLPWVKESVR